MRAIILKNGQFEEVKIDKKNGLEDYYNFLECRTFDIQTAHILGYNISMYIDDEALFVKNNIVYNAGFFRSPLAGNILFLGGIDKKGNTLELQKEITTDLLNNFITLYGVVR
jgi:hypothetical protein